VLGVSKTLKSLAYPYHFFDVSLVLAGILSEKAVFSPVKYYENIANGFNQEKIKHQINKLERERLHAVDYA